MSKELEALERYGYHCNHYENGKEDYKTIETELKRLEHYDRIFKDNILDDCETGLEIVNYLLKQHINNNGQHIIYDDELKVIETELEAFEIIKSKGVAVGLIQLEEVGLKEYNDYIGDKKLYLIEEQFNFVKEVIKK